VEVKAMSVIWNNEDKTDFPAIRFDMSDACNPHDGRNDAVPAFQPFDDEDLEWLLDDTI
jgi:hypothetical protein